MTFTYPRQQSHFTTVLRPPTAETAGMRLARIHTSAGYNHNPVRGHIIGVHLGAPVPILHQREGRDSLDQFHPGDMLITPSGADVHYAHPAAVDALYIELDPDTVLQTAASMGLPTGEARLRDDFGVADPTVHQIGRMLLREMQSPGLGGRLYLEALRTQLTIHLLRHYAAGKPLPAPTAAESRAEQLVSRLRPAVEYIHDHLSEDLSLADLAAVVHLTPHYFSRLFRQAYGISPHQYVIRQRVVKARRLLENPRLTVAEVALRVGFADHSHLVRHYKRLTGTTPRR